MATPDCITHSHYFIYRIVCTVNGKVYIGQTYDLRHRKKHHFHSLKHKKHHNSHLQRAYNRYGADKFYFEVLEKDIPYDLINNREIYWVSYFDSFKDGFNKTPGGDCGSNWKQCSWNGIVYISISAAAIANNISSGSMYERLKKGYSCDDDMGKSNNYIVRPCIWDGKEYPSIATCAKENGLSRTLLRTWIERGWTSLKETGLGKKCIWEGKEYPNIRDCAKEIGVTRATLSRYLERGLSSFSQLPYGKPIRAMPVIWNGIEYKSRVAASKALGIHREALKRFIDLGYKCDDDIPDGCHKRLRGD